MLGLTIRPAVPADKPDWLRMRLALWPDGTEEDFMVEMDALLADPKSPVFVAERSGGKLGAFIEAGQRSHGEGCETSPVGYIEGWYVDEDLRRRGVGALLVRAAEDWARSQGFTEIGSDTWLDNEESIHAHLALGYEEVERLVHFYKAL